MYTICHLLLVREPYEYEYEYDYFILVPIIRHQPTSTVRYRYSYDYSYRTIATTRRPRCNLSYWYEYLKYANPAEG